MSKTIAKSQTSLASAVGVSRRTVGEWVGRSDWPFGRTGPFVVAKVIAWRATIHKPRADPDLDRVSTALKMQRVQKLRVETKILEDSLVPLDQIEAISLALVASFMAEAENMVASLPRKLVGLDAPAIEEMLRDHIDAARARLANTTTLELVPVAKSA